MSPRRNYPKRRAPRAVDETREPLARDIVTAPAGWHARRIEADRAVKMYRCPGCNQEIKPGIRHVVAWREGADEHRRHWHTPCWARSAR